VIERVELDAGVVPEQDRIDAGNGRGHLDMRDANLARPRPWQSALRSGVVRAGSRTRRAERDRNCRPAVDRSHSRVVAPCAKAQNE
jgi:hypothetical protein